MKQLIVILILMLGISSPNIGQTITYEDFREVIPLLKQEDYKAAYQKTDQMLKVTVNDSSDLRGIVTYMNIYSAAGMVTRDQMSYEQFEKATDAFIGHYLVMPAHPCIDSAAYGFNSIQFLDTDSGDLQGMTITSNQDQSSILLFEYFSYIDPIDPSEMLGKNIRNGGILISIETNPNKSKVWVARIRIDDAFARVMAPN